MSRDTPSRVRDALDAIEKCCNYSQLAKTDPRLTAMAEDAIERNLQVLGESLNHLPTEVTDQFPEVPWAQIRGFRNLLVHQYFIIDTSIIEDIVANHLPLLEDALRQVVQP
ncbi:hypothetical protein CGLAU_01135 [Corynebacterium glaucum]|uniref:Toxin-antitoxin system antitoxin subunit n=1 Tax=Corynebacterium glaucum TaxID=187491 RepID=A0A1Q2HTT1_9CORY|nr:hypothetical protein CGLAU_01135 [Corynebacterium glaucum]WJZ06736.1 hypothetical protein CGLAUT_01120 [Corynebacterium glaucum]